MKGYYAIIRPHCRTGYECVFPDLALDNPRARTVEEALHRGQAALNRYVRSIRRRGGRLPTMRAARELVREATRRDGVAAACLVPR